MLKNEQTYSMTSLSGTLVRRRFLRMEQFLYHPWLFHDQHPSQLTGFYMKGALVIEGLNFPYSLNWDPG